LRMDSSNFNPQPSWNIGAQLLAMNIQTLDEGMRLNRSKFRVNGQCGFLLKPKCLRQDAPMKANDGMILTVKIICGSQLPKPKNSKSGEVIDPFVELFINGIDADDTTSKRQHTKVVDDNGFNPRWGESFTFTIQCVELATLTLRVMEKDTLSSEFIGDNSIPLSSIREGVRCVPLYVTGDAAAPSPVGLLCHFSWRRHQPDGFVVVDGEDEMHHAMSFRTASSIPTADDRKAMREARRVAEEDDSL
jgi:hypothetical protein